MDLLRDEPRRRRAPYAETSLVARVSLSFGAVIVPSAIMMGSHQFWNPRFFAVRLSLILSMAWMIALWVVCFLPLVVIVDERNGVFTLGRFPLLGAGLTVAFSVILSSMMHSRVVLTLHLAWPAITGLIAGAAYALALRWLRNRTASTIEAGHVPWQ